MRVSLRPNAHNSHSASQAIMGSLGITDVEPRMSTTEIAAAAQSMGNRQPTAVRAKATGPRPLRPVSQLAPNPTFAIDKVERFQRGLFFYNNKFRGANKNAEMAWMSMVAQALFPEIPQKQTTPKIRNNFKALLDAVNTSWINSGVETLVSLKKDDAKKRFVVTVPILCMPLNEGLAPGMSAAAYLASGNIELRTDPNFHQLTSKGRELAGQTLRVPLNRLHEEGNLKKVVCDNLIVTEAHLIVRPLGTAYTVALIELVFTKRECEYMTNTEWLAMRPLDMYGMLHAWVEGYFGKRFRSPTSTIPLIEIAKQSDAKTVQPRLSADGILVNEDAEFYAIPAKLNNIYQYEDKVNSAFTQPDGSFSARGEDNGVRVAPVSMPVYVDWVNLKFAYTAKDNGKLQIMNLDRSQPMNVTHARRFLESPLGTDKAMHFLTYTLQLGVFAGLIQASNTKAWVNDLLEEVEVVGLDRESYQNFGEIPLVAIFEYSNGDEQANLSRAASPHCQEFVKLCKNLQKFIEDNPTNAYVRYSVPTVLTTLAHLKIFNLYAPKYADLMTQDNSKRAAYLDQGVDPKYKLPSVPMVEQGRGLMPHQVKVQNYLKDRPDNAIVPVAAGGGKTAIGVYEILREVMEDDGKQGLCLVMPPSHLVAQYVKEFTYFTGSRINVIPITSYTVRRHGYARLQIMIQNAPVNSVVVADYNVVALGNNSIAYGSSVVRLFPGIEFLRQFYFKYVFCDESHFLKNGSTRNSAVGRLIIDIPRKRLASGTMVTNTMLDLVRQAGLMDPTIFGTESDFIKEYALETRGSKVISWKPGAELVVKRKLKRHVVIAEAHRKEWAALLPFPKIAFHRAVLSQNQMVAYRTVLEQVIEVIQEKAKENKTLAALLSGEVDPEEIGVDLDAMMKPYLARLERFITAPGKDVLGKTILKGEDLVSPKVHIINELCLKHLNGNIPGKILIFTNYEFSTDAIWEGLAMVGLQDQAIYYTAANKEECGAEFEKNPKKKILVGIEQSLNTGLNLQFASRLIRPETVWTPGVAEQGNSRIGRPNIKVKETRETIYYDTIVANNTIDVTKSAYLMAKTVMKAKFDEAGNPRFDNLDSPPLLKMTLDTIQSSNDFDTTLYDYFQKFAAYEQALHTEYAEYREKNKDVLFNADGTLKIEVLQRAPNPEGSALMRRIPYVPGTELYKSADLGLFRYDDYLAKHKTAHMDDDEEEVELGEDEEDDDSEISEKDLSAEKLAALMVERDACTGLAVHTDFGDGEIVRVNPRNLRVRLPSGEIIRVKKLSAFIITRAETSQRDIRDQLLKLTGDVPLDKPIDVLEIKIDPAVEQAARKKLDKDKNAKSDNGDERVQMTLEFAVVNDYLGISLTNLNDARAVKVAQANGFMFTPDYFAARVMQPRQLVKFFQALSEKGFTIDKECNAACIEAYQHFKMNQKLPTLFYGFAAGAAIRNFFRKEFKPKADKTYVQPYPLVHNEQLWLCLPRNGHPGSLAAIGKTKISNLRWKVYDKDSELINFVGSKPKASSVIQRLIGMGVNIINLKELKDDFKSLRMVSHKGEADK